MNYKVVLVDDEKWTIVDLLKSIVWEDYGFHVEAYFTSPTKALGEIAGIKPDVVFTDIKMPRISGIKLIEQLKKAELECEFVIISAHSDFESARQAIKLNVIDYCLKPINTEALGILLMELKKRLDSRKKDNNDQAKLMNPLEIQMNKDSFEKILDYIRQHYSEKILLADIADQFFVNKNYICNLFQKNMKTTFSHYITEIRIDEAKRLLRNSNLSLESIAVKTGIGDNFYFNKVFKKHEGVSPGAYRKNIGKDVEYEKH